jgi:hypothetical protein
MQAIADKWQRPGDNRAKMDLLKLPCPANLFLLDIPRDC